MKKICCIDGGGVAGAAVADFLENTEKICLDGKAFGSKFDAFAGTSTGSIIAACLAFGFSGVQINNIYKLHLKEIFAPPDFTWKMNPYKPKYDSKNLKRVLKSYFGETLMKDLKIPLYIPTTNIKTEQTKVWDINDDVPVWYAVLTSCSAPTFFPVVDDTYCDGGMWANNPVLAGTLGYKRETGLDMKDISVFSLGTACSVTKENKVSSITKLSWLPIILGFLTKGNESASDFYAKELGLGQYLRFQPSISKDFILDDVKCVPSLMRTWEDYFYLKVNDISNYFNS